MSGSAHRLVAVVVVVLLVAAVVWGFHLVGSPEQRRLERLDERRLDDLQTIVWELRDLVVLRTEPSRLQRPLPRDLEVLAVLARGRRVSTTDPETREPYGYRVLDDRRIELCATFDRARDGRFQVFWNHPAGRHCFVVDVLDPP